MCGIFELRPPGSESARLGEVHDRGTRYGCDGLSNSKTFYALTITGARQTVYITNAYFAPDRSFIELLTAAARAVLTLA